MADYLTQLGDFPSKLASSKRILVALPGDFSVDSLASSLALALALQKAGKNVFVVSEGTPLVSHSNLYGIGDIKSAVPTSGEGNFIIKLDGVVDPSGQMNTVPSLEKLDWYPEGSALNLVFHVVPGQRFEPTKVDYSHETSGFDTIFVVGAAALDNLGAIYLKNASAFSKATVVNIDTDSSNTQFGNINVVDSQASSIAEMMVSLIPNLGLAMDTDIASNIVAGLYNATANLTQKVNANTFAAVAAAMQSGGKLPEGGHSSEVVQEVAETTQSVQEAVSAETVVEPEVIQPQTNQIQFNAKNEQQAPLKQSSVNPVVSAPQVEPVAQPQMPVVETVQPQSVVQPVAPQPEAAPQNDLYSNPFLNPGGQFSGGAFSDQSSVVSPQSSASPVTPAPQQDAAFSTPATGPTFNFGPIGQSAADSLQQTAAPIVDKTPEEKAAADAVDVSGALSTIMQAKQQDDAYDLKQVFQVQQMPETPTMANTTVDSAVQRTQDIISSQQTGNSQQPTANQSSAEQIVTTSQPQPVQDSKPQSSPEERPAGEAVHSTNPEAEANPTPDWLVPKIFKGGSLG